MIEIKLWNWFDLLAKGGEEEVMITSLGGAGGRVACDLRHKVRNRREIRLLMLKRPLQMVVK